MPKFEDLTGKKFGKLLVLGLADNMARHNRKWKCECECSSIIDVFAVHLKKGASKSCGCLKGTPRNIREQGLLKCFLCEETKDVNKFYTRGGNEKGYRQPCKECSYWLTSARFYNLTVEKLKELKKIQKCAICDSKDRLVIDHNHKTNTFRDVICHHCNMVLGFCKENISTLDKIKKYLKKHG